jgi:hypothetical protein
MHDNLDENDILRDGQRLRVPMLMRDHLTPLQRAVATPFDASLHRPGFRYAADYTPRREALDQYIRDISNAWRPRDAEPPDTYPLSAGEGSACTINGAPGTLQREGDWLICRPAPADPATDPRVAAYRDYCDGLTNAWRTP